MVTVVAEFFGIIGLDLTPPATMAELIPYMLVFFAGVILVSGMFRIFGKLVDRLLDWRRLA